MTTDTKLLPLPELPVAVERFILSSLGRMKREGAVAALRAMMRDYARANMAPLIAEIEALRAEVGRLRQLVNGGRGPLPTSAVAWLDMSLGEASLAFDKKSDSNRANKRRVRELFHRVSAGYYPLYLEPQADRAERLAEALRLIAAPQRPDGSWNRDREACRQIAEEALRNQEDGK